MHSGGIKKTEKGKTTKKYMGCWNLRAAKAGLRTSCWAPFQVHLPVCFAWRRFVVAVQNLLDLFGTANKHGGYNCNQLLIRHSLEALHPAQLD